MEDKTSCTGKRRSKNMDQLTNSTLNFNLIEDNDGSKSIAPKHLPRLAAVIRIDGRKGAEFPGRIWENSSKPCKSSKLVELRQQGREMRTLTASDARQTKEVTGNTRLGLDIKYTKTDAQGSRTGSKTTTAAAATTTTTTSVGPAKEAASKRSKSGTAKGKRRISLGKTIFLLLTAYEIYKERQNDSNNNNNNFSSSHRCLNAGLSGSPTLGQVGQVSSNLDLHNIEAFRVSSSSCSRRGLNSNSRILVAPSSKSEYFPLSIPLVRFGFAFESGEAENPRSGGEITRAAVTSTPESANGKHLATIRSLAPFTTSNETITTTTTTAKGQANRTEAEDSVHNVSSLSPSIRTTTAVSLVEQLSTTTNNVSNSGIKYSSNYNNINSNVNVLCNSRCSCIILEPIQTLYEQNPQSNRMEAPSEPNSTLIELERALIAFNEDYSSDEADERPTSPSLAGSINEEIQQSSSGVSMGVGGIADTVSPSMSSDGSKLVEASKSNFPQQKETNSISIKQWKNPSQEAETAAAEISSKNRIAAAIPSAPAVSDVEPESKSPTLVFPLPPNNFHHYRNRLHSHQHHRHMPPSSGLQSGVGVAMERGGGVNSAATPQRLQSLRSLNLIGKLNLSELTNAANFESGNFSSEIVDKLALVIKSMESEQVESILLARNDIKFEFWAEIYALIVVHCRRRLYQLDVSHNSLAKLGITFTGYIEHHLAASRGDWPFNPQQQQQQQQQQQPQQQQLQQQQQASNQSIKLIGLPGSSSQPLGSSQQSSRPKGYTLTSGGKLYSLVQRKLQALEAAKQTNSNATNQSSELSTAPLVRHATPSQASNQFMLIKALDLSHNNLKWLISDQFRALRYVQSIRLDHNKIRFIHQHAFTGLESLRFLNLNFNKLQVIYIEQFQTNFNLLSLMLRNNNIAYLRAGSFASLSNLKRLDLSRNKLTVLSNNALIGLESLEWLNLSSNQFVHAPSASLHPLTSLRQLDLSDNLIVQLAPGTFLHLPIEELWLSDSSKLIDIERGAFWDLPYLRLLHLSSCPILMSINSQAFVATQNLHTIEAENCPSLEPEARQLLDNITIAATYRLLRLEQQRFETLNTSNLGASSSVSVTNQNPLETNISNLGKLSKALNADKSEIKSQFERVTPANFSGDIATNTIVTHDTRLLVDGKVSPSEPGSASNSANSGLSGLNLDRLQLQLENPLTEIQMVSPQIGAETERILKMANNNLSYAYYATSLVFLVVALKLVFKYTSTTHYLGYLRRSRRVYESETPDDLSLNSYRLTDTRPNGLMLGASKPLEASEYSDHSQERSDEGQPEELVCHPTEPQPIDHLGETEAANEEQRNISSISAICDSIQVLVHAGHLGDIPSTSGSCTCPECPSHSSQYDPLEQLQLQPESTEHQQSGDNPAAYQSSGIMLAPPGCSDGTQTERLLSNDTTNISILPVSDQQAEQTQQQQQEALDQLIQNHLMASGYDYGHANCAHFYQSLGPALQFADMTANFVNQIDYY